MRSYELSDHLGNVRVVLSDKLAATGETDVLAAYDYYPFGMMARKIEPSNLYRFGFNGMEREDDITGVSGGHYDFGARIYDPRIGRWLACDPLVHKYPYASPYNYSLNTPVSAKDPDGKDVLLIIWATEKGAYGHAAIAVSNYKKEAYKVIENGIEVTKTRMVKDGTYTYFDLWPGKDNDGDGKADEIGSAGPGDAFTGPPAFYQIKTKLTDGSLITEDVIKNQDPSEAEGRSADGVIKLYSDYEEDMETIEDLKSHRESNDYYTSVTNNCSDLGAAGVAEDMDRFKTYVENNARESYYILQYTTPNALYKLVKEFITDDPKEGIELKDPGTKVDNEFADVIIEENK